MGIALYYHIITDNILFEKYHIVKSEKHIIYNQWTLKLV